MNTILKKINIGLLTGLVIGVVMSTLTALAGIYTLISLPLIILEISIPMSIFGFLFEKALRNLKIKYLKFTYWMIVFPFYRVLLDIFEFLRTNYLPTYYENLLAFRIFIGLQSIVGILFSFVFTFIYMLIYSAERKE